jgi:hypothetical protein
MDIVGREAPNNIHPNKKVTVLDLDDLPQPLPGQPARPVFDQAAEPDQFNNFFIRRIFQQPMSRPILIQPAERLFSNENFADLLRVDVIIPDVRKLADYTNQFSMNLTE